VNRSGNPWWS